MSPESTAPAPSPRRLVLRAGVASLLLAGPVAAAALALSGPPLALGVALGAAVGWLDLALLAWVLAGLLAEPARHRPRRPGAPVFPRALWWKWPPLLLALGAVLWLTPARPEGLLLGVLLQLAAAAFAARSRPAPP